MQRWDDLATVLAASPFGHPLWVSAWNEAFGDGNLLVASLRRGDELAAVLPLMARRGALHTPTNSETPLFEPLAIDEAAAARLAHDVLRAGPSHLLLDVVDADAASTGGLRAGIESSGFRELCRPSIRSPHVPLGRPWQEYEARLSSGRGRELRRRQRRLEEVRGPLRLEVADGSEHLQRLLTEAFGLEASGWKASAGTAIRSRPATEHFYRIMAQRAAERGWLRLAFLRAGDTAIAFDLCLEHREVHYLVKTGFDSALAAYGPGMLLREAMLRRAHEAPLRSYELLGNNELWKREWASDYRQRLTIKAFSPTLAGLPPYVVDVYGRSFVRRARSVVRAWRHP